jgi:hypothetical protein
MVTSCTQKLASFPNTRERPRKPTLTSDTGRIMANGNTTIGIFDPSGGVVVGDEGKVTVNGNTVVKAYDPDRTYITLRNVDPSEAMVYGYRDRANLHLTGMILKAGDSVDCDSLDTIYARSLNVLELEIRTDFGRG